MDIGRIMSTINMAVYNLFNILYWVLFIRVMLTWVPGGRDSIFYRVVASIIDPFLLPIQKMVRKSPIARSPLMVDFSPVVLGMFMTMAQVLISTVTNAILINVAL